MRGGLMSRSGAPPHNGHARRKEKRSAASCGGGDHSDRQYEWMGILAPFREALLLARLSLKILAPKWLLRFFLLLFIIFFHDQIRC